ncbi:MAG TPA: cell envelope integrity protein CreD [Burkholderiales bacterium]
MNFRAAAKFAAVGLLALLLFVPVLMIQNLVAERQRTRNEVVNGIADGWGKRQVVSGPYLALPYERHWTEVKRESVDGRLREMRSERAEARVLRVPAASVDWSGDADIGEKARGIYKARLYTVKLHAQGSIDVPARSAHEDGTSRYKWGTPRLVVGVSDPLGIRAASGSHDFEPGAPDTGAGLQSVLRGHDLSKPGRVEFSIDLELAGSEAFSLAPLGADATIALRADWPHPSFQGRFLPASHDIGAGGFTARWKISRLAAQGIGDAGAAVWFIEPVSLYRQLERASKYGFLFIGLTFAAFLVLELLRRLAIHPVQYALVGLALAMFFLLLTALSEHIDFAAAYTAASAACVGLITTYLVRVLKSARIAAAFGATLGALYAMLYALLKAEDYALLGGALLLFGLLAAVMLATRRVEWYQLMKTGA